MTNQILRKFNKKAFSVVEVAVMIVFVGIVVASITKGKGLINATNSIFAQIATSNSVVGDMEGVALWVETVSNDSFDPVPSDGGSIGQWKDLHPNNPSASTFTVSHGSPTYRASGINGRPAIEFDGNDGFMTAHSSALALIGDMTFFVVFSVDSTSRPGSVFVSKTVGNSSRPYDFNVYNNYLNFWVGNGVTETRPIFTTNSVSQADTGYIFSFTKHPTTATLHINGTLFDTKSWTQTGADGATPLYIGIRGAINAVGMDGKIGEIIMFNRALTDEEREDVDDYLKAKWGIS